MKNSIVFCLIFIANIVPSGPNVRAHNSPDNANYSAYDYTIDIKSSAADFLVQQNDLRLLFVDSSRLAQRIENKMVHVEARALPYKIRTKIETGDIFVEKTITMRELLNDIGLRRWNGGQPQMKLIRQNSIIQSPLFSSNLKRDRELFFSSTIEPGDIIVLSRIP